MAMTHANAHVVRVTQVGDWRVCFVDGFKQCDVVAGSGAENPCFVFSVSISPKVTSILSAFSTTWLLVKISPSRLITNPVPMPLLTRSFPSGSAGALQPRAEKPMKIIEWVLVALSTKIAQPHALFDLDAHDRWHSLRCQSTEVWNLCQRNLSGLFLGPQIVDRA